MRDTRLKRGDASLLKLCPLKKLQQPAFQKRLFDSRVDWRRPETVRPTGLLRHGSPPQAPTGRGQSARSTSPHTICAAVM